MRRAEALYKPPAPGGESKSCANCAFFVISGRCLIHPASIRVAAERVCHYWIFGRPQAELVQIKVEQPLSPKFTGLGFIPGGVACGSCHHYRPRDSETGVCTFISEYGAAAPVHCRGSCSHWEGS